MPMLSVSSLFSAYASITALIGLVKQFYEQVIPERVRDYISGKIEEWFTNKAPPSTLFTLVIEQYEDGDYEALNQVFIACEAYLASKLRSCSTRLKASRMHKKEHVSFKLAQGERFSDVFEGMQLQWNFVCKNGNGSSSNLSQASDAGEGSRSGSDRPQYHFFELCFDPEYKDKVFDSYLPYILKFYDDMIERKKELRLFTLDWVGIRNGNSAWKSVTFNHPFTFDALAMEPEAKQAVVDDLDRFLGRREFYRKVGRAWKRGYLLFGPPGTGKSSLIAAVANYIKFDIYDLQLSSVPNDFFLRRLLLSTSNRSIVVIEDIDCSLGLTNSRQAQINGEVRDRNGNQGGYMGSQISLSGLLNFIDGLWSSCGDERLFIFTTNHKEKLDPALLRPGRMDMHIHMSYLTMPAFRVLALNYLNISGEHHLFNEIEELLKGTSVSPAQVAEELIKSEDPDVALSSLINMLKHHKWVQYQRWVQYQKQETDGKVGSDLAGLTDGKIGSDLAGLTNGVHSTSDQMSTPM